jgi:hypothetical protein
MDWHGQPQARRREGEEQVCVATGARRNIVSITGRAASCTRTLHGGRQRGSSSRTEAEVETEWGIYEYPSLQIKGADSVAVGDPKL